MRFVMCFKNLVFYLLQTMVNIIRAYYNTGSDLYIYVSPLHLYSRRFLNEISHWIFC